jgi:starch phosphorylase
MRPIQTFTVVPALPPALQRLRDVAYDLRWSWHHESIALFRRLDRDLWESSGHNPVRMLGCLEQHRLDVLSRDDGFLGHLQRIADEFDGYRASTSTWFMRKHGQEPAPLVAYFSAEFGLTECMSIFAGGLGVLAGDHLKSTSDLGLPLVAVGLLYQQGYFRQVLNDAGWQQQIYEDNDFYNLPIELVRAPDGAALRIAVPELGRPTAVQVWRARVGRVQLYLLDTNLGDNQPAERDVTDQLYGGDGDLRIRQEIVLGIGGYRVLEKLGLEPSVYHLNEGHSAFLALEHARRLAERHHLTFAEALEVVSAQLVFTTHTPVAAGHDYFPPHVIERYLGGWAKTIGLDRRELLALGRLDPNSDSEPFCMSVLALRVAAYSNGVSRLHGRTSRHMWRSLWPGVPEEEIPIRHVTNGVHFRSWISQEMNELYDRYLGPAWSEEPTDRAAWQAATRIPAEELWRTHERRRERLVAFVRGRVREQLQRRGAPRAEIEAAASLLDPEALTIGFARRFATYKRANLLLHDVERLQRILNMPGRPVQIVFAGKAHPRDDAGKQLIQHIVQTARQPELRRRIVFLEDLSMAVTRALVQGCDVWLNTPRRPNEASGTSGMKAVANAVLNLSTLDGWWDEAWHSAASQAAPFGWAIGRGEDYEDATVQDDVEAEALYSLLERDVVPAFYDRGPDGLPLGWIERMRSALGTLCHEFNTHRMVREYVERFYLQASRRGRALSTADFLLARELAAWRARVRAAWPQVQILSAEARIPSAPRVGDEIVARARVQLGALEPEDVRVEVYLGQVDAQDEIIGAETESMRPLGSTGPGIHEFETRAVRCRASGRLGYTVRVRPYHAGLAPPILSGLIVWADTA